MYNMHCVVSRDLAQHDREDSAWEARMEAQDRAREAAIEAAKEELYDMTVETLESELWSAGHRKPAFNSIALSLQGTIKELIEEAAELMVDSRED